jgi:hypothetical protein
MQAQSIKTPETIAASKPSDRIPEAQAYAAPTIYTIGRSSDLLQGSGRHKNDDTGSRGFTVDQY